MLKFSLKRILALRGIEKHSGFLVKKGFTYQQAHQFLSDETPMIKVKHVENLCVALNCTPNDLFEWKPDAEKNLSETHSLNALHKEANPPNLQQLVKDIPSDKLSLIANLLEELKK